MPVITLDSSRLTKAQKAQLAKEFTESAARIMELPKEVFTVLLRENDADNIGVGGTLLSDRQKK
ncbi:MAG: 4-oxalocrotonate tautomerase DmpI [Clostridiaceae bacterium]|nr:4-oxalocrotonate tautomerase family protein [Eubacteriales bacterium]